MKSFRLPVRALAFALFCFLCSGEIFSQSQQTEGDKRIQKIYPDGTVIAPEEQDAATVTQTSLYPESVSIPLENQNKPVEKTKLKQASYDKRKTKAATEKKKVTTK